MKNLITIGTACGLAAAAGAAHADAKGDALLKKVRGVRVKTIQADFRFTARGEVVPGSIKAMRPAHGRMTMRPADGEMVSVSDGKDVFMLIPQTKEYVKTSAQSSGLQMMTLFPNSPLAAFFQPHELGKGAASRYLGRRKTNGKTYEAVELRLQGQPVKQTLFITPAGLVEGCETSMSDNGMPAKVSLWLSNVKLNSPMTAKQFAFTPPAGFKPQKGPEDDLIAAGKAAPEFTLPRSAGSETLSLSAARSGKKATLVNFWFVGCPPCREEFPQLQKLYKELGPQGFEIVAVNAFDGKDEIEAFVKKGGFTFPIVMQGPDGEKPGMPTTAYGVRAFPTNYLLDADGKVVWRSVGFDEKGLVDALAKLGLKQ